MAQDQNLTEDTVIQRNVSKYLASSLGEEIVMMNVDNGDYIGVNNVGSDLWNLLAEPISVAGLVEKITELYDVTPEQVKDDIDIFLKRMLKQQMLVIKDPVAE